ncbi:hypothetical protein TNCV_1013251 [Trichonephila clavipes]|uniref:Uncharacterized protein n=1 Tax=Trichonephila clavipes TaxID=2585209 RepID=A0A8X6VXN0_TRICX|nr:hypothetical protein TNCV_1013251 [Trichonephila clavipes]
MLLLQDGELHLFQAEIEKTKLDQDGVHHICLRPMKNLQAQLIGGALYHPLSYRYSCDTLAPSGGIISSSTRPRFEGTND